MQEDVRNDVMNRLRRVEGQVRGIQRLLKQGTECKRLVSQVKAARTALDAAGKLILACYLVESIGEDAVSESEAVKLIVKF